MGHDAVHGYNNIVGATIFPHNIGLGAARDPSLLRKIGEITAREVRVTGLDWSFGPTLAVVRDIRWGRSYESYSEDPEIVRRYAAAMLVGLQGQLSGNEPLLTGVLKGRMGFDGLVSGDWNSHAQVRGCTKFSCAAAIDAGLDVFMAPDSWKELYANTLRQARSGEISEAR
jgi:beta-glucosidase